jgi:anti-anti-sigma factor
MQPDFTQTNMNAVLDRVCVEAPERLVAETRVDFRAAAMEGMERSVEAGTSALRIDMSGTEDVDASGLGTLVVLQKRARERGLSTQLAAAQPQVRGLLAITKLEALFEFVD